MARCSVLAALKDALTGKATLDDIPRTRVDALPRVEACVDEIDPKSLRSAITALDTGGFVFRNLEDGRGFPRLVGSLGISDWRRSTSASTGCISRSRLLRISS